MFHLLLKQARTFLLRLCLLTTHFRCRLCICVIAFAFVLYILRLCCGFCICVELSRPPYKTVKEIHILKCEISLSLYYSQNKSLVAESHVQNNCLSRLHCFRNRFFNQIFINCTAFTVHIVL